MRQGCHGSALGEALRDADRVLLFTPTEGQVSPDHLRAVADRLRCYGQVDELIDALCSDIRTGDVIVLMSNGSFANLSSRLPRHLAAAVTAEAEGTGMKVECKDG